MESVLPKGAAQASGMAPQPAAAARPAAGAAWGTGASGRRGAAGRRSRCARCSARPQRRCRRPCAPSVPSVFSQSKAVTRSRSRNSHHDPELEEALDPLSPNGDDEGAEAGLLESARPAGLAP
jgi:hypothetical protein